MGLWDKTKKFVKKYTTPIDWFLGAPGTQYGLGQLTGTADAQDMAAQNLQLGKDVFNYQKFQQGIQWRREDNAMQRRAKDLEKAGFSRQLAVGQGGAQAGPVVSATAPRGEPVAGPNVLDAGMKAMQIASSKALIAKTVADTARTNAETSKTQAGQELIDVQKRDAEHNLRIAQENNLPTKDSSIFGKTVRDTSSWFKKNMFKDPINERSRKVIKGQLKYYQEMARKAKTSKERAYYMKMINEYLKMLEQ